MGDITWNDCEIALGGYSNIFSNNTKKEITDRGNTSMYEIVSFMGITHSCVTLLMFCTMTYTLHEYVTNVPLHITLLISSSYSLGFFITSTSWYTTIFIHNKLNKLTKSCEDSIDYLKDQEKFIDFFREKNKRNLVLICSPIGLWILSSSILFDGIIAIFFIITGSIYALYTLPNIENITNVHSIKLLLDRLVTKTYHKPICIETSEQILSELWHPKSSPKSSETETKHTQ